jgi:hypothetical protein
MKKQQRQSIGKELDRIMMTCSVETGNRIRELALKKGVSISKFIADIVETHLDKIEAEMNSC